MHNPFAVPGQWYKGNLHTHSNESDGEQTPQQIVDIYAEASYDFLSITDHNKLTDPAGLDPKNLLLIPGSELNGGRAALGQSYHVVALGLREAAPVNPSMPVQEIIDGALSVGELCWIAHPSWCSITSADLFPVERTVGLEVYNTTCHHGIGRGESSIHWDELLARGLRPLGLGVDDAHWHYPDALGGWIMARAQECTQPAILQAIRDGNFYATSGPQIHGVEFTAANIHVTCSPATEIRLVNPLPGVGMTSFRRGQAGPFTDYTFPRPDKWQLARIEVVDSAGRKAWTNPFYFD